MIYKIFELSTWVTIVQCNTLVIAHIGKDGSCQVSLAVLIVPLVTADLLKVLHPCVGPLRHATCVCVHTKLGVELTSLKYRFVVWKCLLSSTSIPSGNFLLCFPTKGDFTVFFRYLQQKELNLRMKTSYCDVFSFK